MQERGDHVANRFEGVSGLAGRGRTHELVAHVEHLVGPDSMVVAVK